MKKILGISLCALFAVSAANANIASQRYVDDKVGANETSITNLTTRVGVNEGAIATNAGNITTNTNAIATINSGIEGMNANVTTSHFIQGVEQVNGKVTPTGKNFETTLSATTNDNAPTSKAVADYVTGKVSDLNVTALEGRVTVNEGAIASNTSAIGENAAKIATNDTRIATNAGNITTNTNAIATINSGIEGMNANVTTSHFIQGVEQVNGKVTPTGKNFEATLSATTTDNAPTSAAVATHVKAEINALDVDETDGQYVKVVSQADGKVVATGADFAEAVATGGDNAPKSSAVVSYVTAQVQAATPNIDTGTGNGTISVNGADVAVKGLGTAAYTESTAYATAGQGELAESAVQSVTNGTANGTIRVDGRDVAVTGLSSAAYKESTYFATATDLSDVSQRVSDNETILKPSEGCESSENGCTLVFRGGEYLWELVARSNGQ